MTQTTENASGMIAPCQQTTCLRMEGLPKEALQQVAAYFQALSEPTRLALLNLLREGERNVGELALQSGFTTANVSRHLTLLTKHGLIARDSRGTSVYYRIADDSVYALCDLVCGNIARQFERAAGERAAFSAAGVRGAVTAVTKPTRRARGKT